MAVVVIDIGSTTESHLAFNRGMRLYVTTHDLDWDIHVVNGSLPGHIPDGSVIIQDHAKKTAEPRMESMVIGTLFGADTPSSYRCITFDERQYSLPDCHLQPSNWHTPG